MIKLPSCSYKDVLRVLKREGWSVIRQKGSHIRLIKYTEAGFIRVTVPAHDPLEKFILHSVLRDARISLERFLELLRK
jgi:predicted RNA binding protein YcfA (HicA-like mRNA interferase family)